MLCFVMLIVLLFICVTCVLVLPDVMSWFMFPPVVPFVHVPMFPIISNLLVLPLSGRCVLFHIWVIRMQSTFCIVYKCFEFDFFVVLLRGFLVWLLLWMNGVSLFSSVNPKTIFEVDWTALHVLFTLGLWNPAPQFPNTTQFLLLCQLLFQTALRPH